MKKCIIIGGGPAGLTAGYELLKKSNDYEVVIVDNLCNSKREVVERRAGDIATCYADPSKTLEELEKEKLK